MPWDIEMQFWPELLPLQSVPLIQQQRNLAGSFYF